MSKDEYLITDTPLKALTVFAMPMILGSFFQQIYNMADSVIVGQFVGSSALAAVGACAALTNVFICVALGAGVGAGVLVSRYFGAREYGKMKTIMSTSLFSFLILSIVLGIFGFCFSRSMMRVLQTPGDILNDTVLYLQVYFAGFPFLFMYNILSNMFTSIGESKIPLGLLIFSSILNIFMDLWMVAGLGLGVFGAALATLIAQGISAMQVQMKMLACGNHDNFTKNLQVSHVEVNGKTLGVIGAGRIGRKVIQIARALDMNILVYTRTPRENEKGIRYVSLEELLKNSDYVSMHCPLTESTKHMINKESLSLMKPSAFIINTSRGALIDETALIEALENGTIAGAGLDVQETEPPEETSPLYTMDQVLLTPHMGWKGLETKQRLVSILADDIKQFMEGNPINVVSGL